MGRQPLARIDYARTYDKKWRLKVCGKRVQTTQSSGNNNSNGAAFQATTRKHYAPTINRIPIFTVHQQPYTHTQIKVKRNKKKVEPMVRLIYFPPHFDAFAARCALVAFWYASKVFEFSFVRLLPNSNEFLLYFRNLFGLVFREGVQFVLSTSALARSRDIYRLSHTRKAFLGHIRHRQPHTVCAVYCVVCALHFRFEKPFGREKILIIDEMPLGSAHAA